MVDDLRKGVIDAEFETDFGVHEVRSREVSEGRIFGLTAGERMRGRDDHRRARNREARAARGVVLEQHESDEHGREQTDDVLGVDGGGNCGTGELGKSRDGVAGGDEESDELE